MSGPGQHAFAALINLEAEAALLGAAMIDNGIVVQVDGLISQSDFYEPTHGRIWAAIVHLTAGGGKCTPVTLRPLFENDPAMKDLNGASSYLARLTADGQGLLAPVVLAAQVAELAARRRAYSAIADVSLPLAAVVDDLGEALTRIGGRTDGRLPVIDLAAWQGPPPGRVSAWGDLLPIGATTLLTGAGGVGKSLLTQGLLSAMALGRPYLGQHTRQARALYVTCEDDTAELWRRQAAICEAMGVNMSVLQGRLHLVSLAGEVDTALGIFDASGRLRPTDRWRQIDALVRAEGIGAFAFDSATDAMAGDLNDIHQVAEFVNLFTGLAIRQDGISIVLHHPNKAGEQWLGSVAWHNKVRSRLIIEADDEGDRDARTLIAPKANYGPSGGKIEFRWHGGAFVSGDDLSDDTLAELEACSAANGENVAFLRCLDICTAQRRNVCHVPSANYAPKVFAAMTEAKGITAKAFAAAMERLLYLGEIEVDAELWPGPNRHPRRGIRRAEGRK